MTPRRGMRLAGCEYYSKKQSAALLPRQKIARAVNPRSRKGCISLFRLFSYKRSRPESSAPLPHDYSLSLSSHLRTEAVTPGLWNGAMVHVVLNERVAWQRDAFTFPFSLPLPDDRPRLRGLRRAEGRCRSSSTFRT